MDTLADSLGIVGHDRLQVAGPVAVFERAIAMKMSANDGGSPASGGNDAVPWLLYVPWRSGQPSGVGMDFIEAHSVGYGGFLELVAHPNWTSTRHSAVAASETLISMVRSPTLELSGRHRLAGVYPLGRRISRHPTSAANCRRPTSVYQEEEPDYQANDSRTSGSGAEPNRPEHQEPRP